MVNWLSVDVTVQAYGEVRPSEPIHQITAPLTGTLDRLYVGEKEGVDPGQAIADLRPEAVPAPENTAVTVHRIQAPVAGTVLRLSAANPGQRVTVGTLIAEIMPDSPDRVVKAFIPPTEISRVETGQVVQVRVSTYAESGMLAGTVQAISPDTLPCELAACTLPYGYEVDIALNPANRPQTISLTDLRPGMTVTADIVTQRETLLTLILEKLRLTPNR